MGESIRMAVLSDLPRLVELSLASFGPITWQRTVDRVFGPLNGHDWRDRWTRRVKKIMQEQTILVLEQDGVIVGYACGTVDQVLGLGHIEILAVDPAWMGKGYGRRVLQVMEEHFLSQGAAHVTLESLLGNETANSLYSKQGYQQVASHINWFKKLQRREDSQDGPPGPAGSRTR